MIFSFKIEKSFVKLDINLASFSVPCSETSELDENETIPIFNVDEFNASKFSISLLAEFKTKSFLVTSPTLSVMLEELSITNINSPSGTLLIASLLICNCNVTCFLSNSELIIFFSNFEFSFNLILQILFSTISIFTGVEAKTVVEIKINSKHNAIEIFFFIKIFLSS